MNSFKKLKNFFLIHRSPGNWIAWFGILVILGTWLITMRIVHEDRRLELLRAQRETGNLSLILERHIHETFSRIDSSLLFIRGRWDKGTGPAGLQTLLSNHTAANPDLFNLISIIDSGGNIILTDKEKFQPTYSGDRPFFIYHKENPGDSIRVWRPAEGRVTGKWYIPVSLRLNNYRGEFAGVLVASINPDYFSMIFREISLGEESLVYLADFNGIIYSGILGGKDIGLDKVIEPSVIAGIVSNKEPFSEINISCVDGVERFSNRAFIREKTMFVSVGVSIREYLGPSRSRFLNLVAVELLFSLIILLLMLRMRRAVISEYELSAELDRFFSNSIDLLCIVDLEGRFRRVNMEWENLLGYRTEELENRNFLDLVHPDDKQASANSGRIGGRQNIRNFINRYRCRDGSYRYIEWRSTPHGEMVYATGRDITEQKKNEEALRESEGKLKAIFNAVNIGFGITDDKGLYVMYNKRLADLLGYEYDELKQKTLMDITYPEDIAASMEYFTKVIRGEIDDYRIEKRYIRKDGKIIWCDITVTPVRGREGNVQLMVGVVNDVTGQKQAEEERKKLQEQLNQAQKMESVGRLAGGVAHDFNNMLGAIFGYTELSLRKIDKGHPVYAYLQEIKRAAERSADLTRQLLAFARRQTVTPKILDLNETLEGMLKMLRQLIGEDIALEWLPAAGPVMIKIDPVQIDQILVNLCVNARDAITGTGRIIIETGKAAFAEDNASMDEKATPGDYVLLSVRDTGKGMDKETLEHLFEPFFTTKETGKGTGLGLATVYGIVKQNRGFINVYSDPETGTTFRIYLPLHHADDYRKEQEPATREPGEGHETILLVEDEAMLLDMSREMLEQLGYTVLAAASPAVALRISEEFNGTIDLLITDVIMPGMNGRELTEKILPIYPDLKILFMSGYTASIIAQHGVLEEGVNFIQKPFSLTELADKVKKTLSNTR